MPNWKTHIEISKELNKKLKYNDEEFQLFVFGSILPDINNGYLLNNVSKVINHKITHFDGYNKTYINFYNKYKEIIKEPLIMGYYTHLYTDFNWNKNFYENKVKIKHNKEEHNELRKMKQNDFKIYNNKFIKNTIQINNIDDILNETNKIVEISITKEDILAVKSYLDSQKAYIYDFKFYNEKELDKLKEDTINDLKNIIENDTLANS